MIKRRVVKKGQPNKTKEVDPKLPTSVKVGYRDIEIQYVSPDFLTDSLTDCYGEYRAREGKILVQHNLCGQEMACTIFHEVGHAIVYGSGLNQANSCLKEDDNEEIVVNQMTNYFMGVFRDNPWFLDFLKEQLAKDVKK